MCDRSLANPVRQAKHAIVPPKPAHTRHRDDLARWHPLPARTHVPQVQQLEERDGRVVHRGDVHCERARPLVWRAEGPERLLERLDVGRGVPWLELVVSDARVVHEEVDIASPVLDGLDEAQQGRVRSYVALERYDVAVPLAPQE